MKKPRKGRSQIPQTPSGLTLNVTAKFTIEELTAVLTPNQIRAFLRGIGDVVKAQNRLAPDGTQNEREIGRS